MMNYSQKLRRYNEHIEALEEERLKIQVFQRELPLCFELVTQAIDGYRQQLAGTSTEYFPGRSECSEQTSSEAPVLEEFIPLKRSCSSEDEEEESRKSKNLNDGNSDKTSKKTDWLRSVQLWNQQPDQPLKEDQPPKIETKKIGGAFHPFHKEKSFTTTATVAKPTPSSAPALTAATSSTAETVNGSNGSGRRDEKEGESHRKPRRCWSPELHRRFLNALHQLGGSHAATPRQIKDLMKVDGLTNDEVKSHLQKYRLHMRRPSPAIQNNSSPQPPQFVVVGGIWVPRPEYAAVAVTTGETTRVAANGLYAPVAAAAASTSLSQQQQQQKQRQRSPSGSFHSEERGSRHSLGNDNAESSSPATSSSTRTITALPAS